MDTSAPTPNLAATTLALLILADLLPAPGYEPAHSNPFRYADEGAATCSRHRRHRP